MIAEAKRRLLLPPPMTPTEHMEQAVASLEAPTLWVRGAAGERTTLPGKEPVLSAGIQIQIALPIISEPIAAQVVQPPPPPQVLFRAREVIQPPPASSGWDDSPGPPGSAQSDPVDSPPGLADEPPGFEEETPPQEELLPETSEPDGEESEVESGADTVPEDAQQLQETPRAGAVPSYPADYYEGAPGTLPSDPVDAPPGLADTPPGFDEGEPEHTPQSPMDVLSEADMDLLGMEDVSMTIPPVRPAGKPLILPPVAHHQVGASVEGHVKLAPPVRPQVRVDEPPEWKPVDEPPEWKPVDEPPEWKPVVESSQAAIEQPVVEEVLPLPSLEESAGDGGVPPGFELDAHDELEADMQLFGELDEETGEVVRPVQPGDGLPLESEVLPGHDLPWEGEASDGPMGLSGAPGGEIPSSAVVPVSAAGEAFESVWQTRPLSERLAAGSLLVLGVWAIWRVWSVI